MVWGLVDPNGFGDCFPNGKFVGWKEATKKYFDEEMSASQRAMFDNCDVAYREDLSRKFVGDMGPLEPHERPPEYRTTKTHKSLGSLVGLSSRLLAVDATLKEIIERLEPDVHQFWRLAITMPNGSEYPAPYYGMVIRRFIDSFVPEQSAVHQMSEGSEAFFTNGATEHDYSNLTVLKRVVGQAHLWRERKLLMPGVFLSDELQAKIARKGLLIPQTHRLKTITEPDDRNLRRTGRSRSLMRAATAVA